MPNFKQFIHTDLFFCKMLHINSTAIEDFVPNYYQNVYNGNSIWQFMEAAGLV